MPVNPLNVRQKFRTTDVLRLEVETVPASGLKNRVANPSGDLGAWGWTAGDVAADVHQVTVPGDGFALQYTVGTAVFNEFSSNFIAVTPGQWIGGRFEVTSLTATRKVLAQVRAYDANRNAGAILATISITATGAVTYWTPNQVPAGAAYVRVNFQILTSTSGAPSVNDLFAVHRVMVTTGNANPGTGFGYVEPFGFVNILGGSHEIEIDRQTLDVGVLKATVIDPNLDPAVSGTLAAGRRCRVMAYVAAYGWLPLFVGTVRDLRTDYVLDPADQTSRRPRITLVATDALADLANIRAAYGVQNANELSAALKGAPWPWCLENTSGFSNPAFVFEWSRNSNASLVDQVAVCRDSLGMGSDVDRRTGHAWVDRRGVLQLWQTPPAERAFVQWLNPTGGSPTRTNATSAIVTGVTTHAGGVRNVYRLTATAAGAMTAADAGTFPFEPAQEYHSYDVGVWVKAFSTGRAATLSIEWEGEYPGILSTSVVVTATDTAGTDNGWVKLAGRVTAPAGARWMRRKVTFAGCAAGEQHDVDELTTTGVRVTYTNDASAAVASTYLDSYTDLSVDWSLGSIINTVTVNYLRQPEGPDGDSEVVVYGPYVDQGSIDTYGAWGVTLTVNGFEDPADIAAVAQAMLGANARPSRTVEAMTVAVQTDAGIQHAVLTDLADVIDVDYVGFIDAAPRVYGLKHTITPEAWAVEYTFTPSGSVAIPQVIPAPAAPALAATSSAAASVMRYGPVKILTGTAPATGAAGTSVDSTYTFTEPFSGTPIVILHPQVGVPAAPVVLEVQCLSKSSAGFTFRTKWSDSSSHSGGAAQFIAIGPA